METDSHIIHYATWSINNESPLQLRERYHKPNSKKSTPKNSIIKKNNLYQTSKHKKSILAELKHEFRTLFCCFCFLTFKNFKFHSFSVYLILLALASLSTSMIQGGYLTAISTTIQTQFNISTSRIGIIISSFDIMGVFITPIISYIGSRYNKCRIIGICGFFYAVGCAVYTFPYFFSPKYTISSPSSVNTRTRAKLISNITNTTTAGDTTVLPYSNIEICVFQYIYKNWTSTSTASWHNLSTSTQSIESQEGVNCVRDISNSSWPYYTFILGQLLMSIGIAPLFSLGIVFMCDNLDESKHALYTGKI